MIAASIILIVTYFFPLWSISLQAPQYPEGLGLYIYLDKIDGHKSGDLQSINGLNHYIGMKKILPESITELKIMPYFIAFMILFGLIAALTNNKYLKIAWVVIFIIAGVVGLYDFYMWEYDYGHNLDPKAIIKIPGMSYQPPLIGSKQLLNFNATSLPGIGFYFILISLALTSFSIIKDYKAKKIVAKD